MFQWFIWDFDGTLFDTYPAVNRALLESLASLGFREDPAETMRRLKERQGPALAFYQRKYGLPDGALQEDFRRRERVLVRESRPFPEALDLCREIQSRGGKNLLYTHRDGSAWELMRAGGMAELFEGGVTSEDGFPPKPAPDAVLFLMQQYAIPPAAAVMVGDRLLDARAGLNAGIAGCLWDPEGAHPDFAGLRVRSLSELAPLLPTVSPGGR